MTRQVVRHIFEETGILPAIRASSHADASFAAHAILGGEIPILELTMTVPGALGLLTDLRQAYPKAVIGAGTVLDAESARHCIDAGALFLTSPGVELSVVEVAEKAAIAMIPGALSPTEVMRAFRAGVDFVKVFPCAQVGGPSYIRALKAPFPDMPLIAAGGVNQATAADYLNAGASVLGIRGELIPPEAIADRDEAWIRELEARFLGIVKRSRSNNQFFGMSPD